MANKTQLSAQSFGQRWIHSFEEDSAQAQVYRPESWDFPLSRRPREAFELRSDGSAQLFLPGPQDRPKATAASWTEEAGELVIRAAKRTGPGPLTLRIVESGADKLLVRRS
ncbi:MAG TPA: hypothetical protein VEG60_27865 [Candidatus Binatia bacterium]|nr:hypothetical protein [Candidatus Binatia bacterium]